MGLGFWQIRLTRFVQTFHNSINDLRQICVLCARLFTHCLYTLATSGLCDPETKGDSFMGRSSCVAFQASYVVLFLRLQQTNRAVDLNYSLMLFPTAFNMGHEKKVNF